MPMALVFNGYELAALIIAIVVARFATIRGESYWFTGIQFLTLYCALGITFYFA